MGPLLRAPARYLFRRCASGSRALSGSNAVCSNAPGLFRGLMNGCDIASAGLARLHGRIPMNIMGPLLRAPARYLFRHEVSGIRIGRRWGIRTPDQRIKSPLLYQLS